MTVSATEFLRRFFLHVLPRNFVRIRFFGFLAHRRRANVLPICRRALESYYAHDTNATDEALPLELLIQPLSLRIDLEHEVAAISSYREGRVSR